MFTETAQRRLAIGVKLEQLKYVFFYLKDNIGYGRVKQSMNDF